MLFNSDTRPDQFGNIRAVKELSSVVNQLDKSRALSETYGGAGWELTFDDMKRLGDWEYVLGVNFLNQHLAHMTLKKFGDVWTQMQTIIIQMQPVMMEVVIIVLGNLALHLY